jgi:hypothetical protein
MNKYHEGKKNKKNAETRPGSGKEIDQPLLIDFDTFDQMSEETLSLDE